MQLTSSAPPIATIKFLLELGLEVNAQKASEAVELITTLMKERGMPIPDRTRTLGGNSAIAAKR